MLRFLHVVLIFFFIGSAHAAKVEDVTVLDLEYEKDSFKLKLQIKDAKKDSYFIVKIVRDDVKAFDKMALVLKKLKLKNSFKLNLDIPSFSPYPSGSFYHSESVKFSGSSEGESLISQ